MGNMPQTEVVLAAASGSRGGLGKTGTLLASGTRYVRLDNSGFARTNHLTWRVKADKPHTVQLFRARSIVDAPAVTLASIADGETGPLLQGLTYQAEDTAASAAWATWYYYTGGADDTADAVQLAALINADYAITPNGSVSVGDLITVVTTDDAGGSNTYVFTAAATPDYPNRKFDQSGNQAAELASIVLALNHKRNVTCASVVAGNTFTLTPLGGTARTYTAHTDTTSGTNFSVSGDDSADATELAVAINTQTALHGYTAAAVGAVVSFTRTSASIPVAALSSSGATLACVNTAGGVPGIAAVATGATGELAITPTWVKSLVVTTSNGTRLPIVDIDCPGVYATSGLGVVTLVPGTPGSPIGGEKASTISAKTGTAAGRCAVAQTATLAGLSPITNESATTISAATGSAGSNGALYDSWVDGWEACYCAVTNNAASDPATIVVAATAY